MPLKSLKRWIAIGPERKKGGGRKVRDPEMEVKLYKWYKSMKDKEYSISPKMIKHKALKLTSNRDFNASKGWLAKFQNKYNLDLYTNKKKKDKTNKTHLPSESNTLTLKEENMHSNLPEEPDMCFDIKIRYSSESDFSVHDNNQHDASYNNFLEIESSYDESSVEYESNLSIRSSNYLNRIKLPESIDID